MHCRVGAGAAGGMVEAMKGRKPKPVEMQVVAGNPGKRALPAKRGVSAIGIECPPEIVGAEAVEWRRLSRELVSLGVLTLDMRAPMERWCVNYVRWRAAEAHVAKHGAIVAAPRTGVPMQNPHLSVANAAGLVLDRLAVEFGLTPSSRTRVGGKVPADGGKQAKTGTGRFF